MPTSESLIILRDFIYPLLVATAAIWAPLLIGSVILQWWLEYVRKETVAKAKWTMLEIKIPKEVMKSPAALELVLTSMHAETKPPLFTPNVPTKWTKLASEFGKFYAALWLGAWPLWWSLEIASIEGNIYFFARVEPKNRLAVENLFYSQFPQAEITETDDYTKYVPPFKAGNGWDLRGCEYKLKETFDGDKKEAGDKKLKMPVDALPIKTYIEYGLNDAFNLEEEQKIDPLVSLLQVMGALGQGEQAWVQIVIQGSWARFENPNLEKRGEKPFVFWQDVGKYYIDDVILKPWRGFIIKPVPAKAEKKDKLSGEVTQEAQDEVKGVQDTGFKNVPEREKGKLESTERNMQKPGYDTGIRIVYLGYGASFKVGRLGELKGAFKQFNAANLNSFEVTNGTDDGFDFPWQDYKDLRKLNNREKMFKRYVKREFFYPPEMGATLALKKVIDAPLVKGTLKPPEISVLTTEELATIFHFPGTVARTSGLTRVEAQKAEPPSNLPI
ncbi:MAG: protein of unknown function with transrane region [Patescibacteria group bacterium]|nr:protein of unknown function with transrane region [Patescibacteria group bacterium]